jgi:hypothetical protein
LKKKLRDPGKKNIRAMSTLADESWAWVLSHISYGREYPLSYFLLRVKE